MSLPLIRRLTLADKSASNTVCHCCDFWFPEHENTWQTLALQWFRLRGSTVKTLRRITHHHTIDIGWNLLNFAEIAWHASTKITHRTGNQTCHFFAAMQPPNGAPSICGIGMCVAGCTKPIFDHERGVENGMGMVETCWNMHGGITFVWQMQSTCLSHPRSKVSGVRTRAWVANLPTMSATTMKLCFLELHFVPTPIPSCSQALFQPRFRLGIAL